MNTRWVVLIGLSLTMVATRFGHMGTAWSLPDASWAIFFVGGFYLSQNWRWTFSWLLALAVAIDLTVINHLGVSNYCLTAAYVFNVPAYAVLWFGGNWLRRHLRHSAGDLLRLAASAMLAVSVCFAMTNGSFYWLGGRVSERTMSGWMENFGDWYLAYLGNAMLYLGIAAIVHLTLARAFKPDAPPADAPSA